MARQRKAGSRHQLKKELLECLILSILVLAIGIFAILNFGWVMGTFIGLIIWLVVLLVVKE